MLKVEFSGKSPVRHKNFMTFLDNVNIKGIMVAYLILCVCVCVCVCVCKRERERILYLGLATPLPTVILLNLQETDKGLSPIA